MKVVRKLWISALVFMTGRALGQNELVIPRNFQPAYAHHTRTMDGRPGPGYWQNKANYNIQVQFDPESRLLTGSVDIQYFNNSPDTLHEIWFKLYPNLYKKGNIRMMKIDPADITDGVHIQGIKINGNDSPMVRTTLDGTNLKLSIPELLPGRSIYLTLTYDYTLNKGSHIRTGEVEAGADFIAYFFPRIAVYDDIDGWNKKPYTGPQEFYNDFCHFLVSVTVPKDYLVWATGNLMNGREVLNEKYFDRLQQAEKSDSVLTIIDSAEARQGGIANPGSSTWKFEADNVPDFAFATSNHYMWQSSSLVVDNTTGRRTRVDAVFNPKHESYYNVIGYARKTVFDISYRFPQWPYPYPHETVFDGLDQMEYPMMVNDNPLDSKPDDIELTIHEIFHTMFPFYMGINETKYGWMDEGWATIGEWLLSPMIDSTISDDYGMETYNSFAGTEMDLPITTLSTDENDMSGYINTYPKPALGYLFVKDLLGEEGFYKGLHYYMSQWNGKHPAPLDFFHCMNTGSGRNLNWFWKSWFYEGGVPNLAITQVLKHGKEMAAVIEMKGTKPVPVDLAVYYADGTKMMYHRDISFWENGNKAISIPIKSEKPVTRLVLGSVHIPDVDPSDNVYEVKP